jgi:hypothetical protein
MAYGTKVPWSSGIFQLKKIKCAKAVRRMQTEEDCNSSGGSHESNSGSALDQAIPKLETGNVEHG